MENNNVNELIEEGKKHLAALEVELTKLVDTAEKVAGVKTEELTQKAQTLISETKTEIEAQKKKIMESEDFKNFEAEGKKALDDFGAQVETITQDVSARLKNLFGSK
ncbi:MAG: hypothetical protein JWO03_2051 [Bacteroidetes bacterium]|nr:hypothetical protein [Bacteroidota bacterium]